MVGNRRESGQASQNGGMHAESEETIKLWLRHIGRNTKLNPKIEDFRARCAASDKAMSESETARLKAAAENSNSK